MAVDSSEEVSLLRRQLQDSEAHNKKLKQQLDFQKMNNQKNYQRFQFQLGLLRSELAKEKLKTL